MKIPSNNQWTQTNNGTLLGVLRKSQNMNFDQAGEARLSRKALALVDSGTTNFGDVMAIVYFDGDYHVITDDQVFAGDLGGNDFDAVASSPNLGAVSDAVVCYSRLYVSDTTALAYMAAGGAWTTGIGSLTASYPHPLAVFDSQPTYKLACGDGNLVKLYDSAGSKASTDLTIPSNFYVTSLVYRNGYLYVGTKEVNGGEAAVFIWNGDGANAQYKVDVGAAWVYAMTPYRGAVVAVTNEGELILINGTSVQQLAAFPVFYAPGVSWDLGNATRGKVYPRGMVALGDVLYINANGDVDSDDSLYEMPSGVWCYDPAVGLYHCASPSTDLWVADTGLSLSSNTITTSATHNLKLGDAIAFTASAINGISSNRLYYAIPVAATTFKVAASRQEAFDGNYMTISGTPGSTALHYAPNTDFGTKNGDQSGAIAVTNYLDSPIKLFGSNIIFGSVVENEAGTTKNVLCVLSDRYNEGSFVTQRIMSVNVTQVWKSLYAFISGVLGSNEKAIIKYIAEERPPTRELSVVWADATTFSCTDPAMFHAVQIGDELEFIQGYGQGRTAHVTAFTLSAATISVTIDEAFGTAAATSVCRVTGFKKVEEITSTRSNDTWKQVALDVKNNWIQIKVDLRGFEPSVQMLEITNSVDKGAI